MSTEDNDRPTAVTRLSKAKSTDYPTMSFTAVTSHRVMAEAFVSELLRAANNIIPDHTLNIHDLLHICQLSLRKATDDAITMVGGRHLRSRIADQVSRANRYEEPFSLVILNLNEVNQQEDYDAIVDTLKERMRQTDLIFLFKSRIALMLPHTDKPACDLLISRILELVKKCLIQGPRLTANSITYPHQTLHSVDEILDWTENCLRV